jgi:hypothetical protein
MADRVSVGARVTIRRGVAAPDVSARQAQAQMNPHRSDAQALLASLGGARNDWPDRVKV